MTRTPVSLIGEAPTPLEFPLKFRYITCFSLRLFEESLLQREFRFRESRGNQNSWGRVIYCVKLKNCLKPTIDCSKSTCNPAHLAIFNISTWWWHASQVNSTIKFGGCFQFQHGDIVSHAIWFSVAFVGNDFFNLHILFGSNVICAPVSSKSEKLRSILC